MPKVSRMPPRQQDTALVISLLVRYSRARVRYSSPFHLAASSVGLNGFVNGRGLERPTWCSRN
jgi:hypothetical protein